MHALHAWLTRRTSSLLLGPMIAQVSSVGMSKAGSSKARAVFTLVGEDVDYAAMTKSNRHLLKKEMDKIANKVVVNLTAKEAVWKFLTLPRDGRKAWRFACGMMCLIFVSTLAMMLETVPGLQKWWGWPVLEAASVAVYTAELAAKVWACPSLAVFWADRLNWVDVVAVVPSYIEIIVRLAGRQTNLSSMRVFRVLRFCRLFRIFKFTMLQEALDDFVVVVGSSSNELVLLIGLMLLVMTVCGVLMQYLEETTPPGDFASGANPFTNALQAMYWVLQTVTCIGYGDIVPVSPRAIAFASIALLPITAIMVSLPITAINQKFIELRESRIEHKQLMSKRKEVEEDQRKLLAQCNADVSLGLDKLVEVYNKQALPSPYPLRAEGWREIDPNSARRVCKMVQETDQRLNEHIDMMANQLLQIYQRAQTTSDVMRAHEPNNVPVSV